MREISDRNEISPRSAASRGVLIHLRLLTECCASNFSHERHRRAGSIKLKLTRHRSATVYVHVRRVRVCEQCGNAYGGDAQNLSACVRMYACVLHARGIRDILGAMHMHRVNGAAAHYATCSRGARVGPAHLRHHTEAFVRTSRI